MKKKIKVLLTCIGHQPKKFFLKKIKESKKYNSSKLNEIYSVNDRILIHNYLNKLNEDKLNAQLILNLDAARSALKTAKEQKIDLQILENIIMRTID